MNMPSELKQAVVRAEGQPIEVVDGADRYFLIKAEVFERLMGILDHTEPGPREKQSLLQAWGKRAGWDEPEATAFDDLKPL
jgi:hypothetical protein